MNLRRTRNLLILALHLLLLGAMPLVDAFAGERALVTQCAPDDDRGGECGSRHAHAGCEFCAALRTMGVCCGGISFVAAPSPPVQLFSIDAASTQTPAQLARTPGARAPPAPYA